jgi:photosystem II stability/assembly factor-like uncharacterized protein
MLNADRTDSSPAGMAAKRLRARALSALLAAILVTIATPSGFAGQKRAPKRRAKAPIARPIAPHDLERDDDQAGRRDWFLRDLIYPTGTIPQDARRKAWLKRPADAPKTSGVPTWRAIGPQPTTAAFPDNWGDTSGRINSIAISPADENVVLIGSATGGIWRSTDGGQTFVPVTDNHVDLAVGSIAFAPSNPSIVYAGMGDPAGYRYLGGGVLKSTDGGQTWARVSDDTLPPHGTTSKLLVDPRDANRVYTAQAFSVVGNSSISAGFYLSTDGGVTWSQTLAGSARDLAIHPTSPATLYLGVTRFEQNASKAGLFRSTDSGQTWTRVFKSPTTTSNLKVAVTPARPDNVYVFTGGVKNGVNSIKVEVSADRGATWTNKGAKKVDKGQFSYNCYIAVDPTNPQTIYVATRDVYRSLDGGKTWQNLTGSFDHRGGYQPYDSSAHPDQHSMAFLPASSQSYLIGNDGGVWKTTTAVDRPFASMNATLGLTMFTSIANHPTNPLIVYGGTQDNGTQRRLDGNRWEEFASGDGGNCVVDPLDPSIVYTTYVYHRVYRWRANGNVFDGIIGMESAFDNGRVAFYPPFTGNGVDSRLYFGTYQLFVSADRGNSWELQGGGRDLTKGGSDVLYAIAVSRSNPNVIYTGSALGRVMRTDDGGRTWQDVTAGLPDRVIRSITVDPANPAVAYVTCSGFGTGHVFKTVDSGQVWTDVSGTLPDLPVRAFLIDPLDATTLYAGTDIGVFVSRNGSPWMYFNDGMPPAIVTAFAAQPTGLVRVATYGRGAFELVR